tara:strand:- start:1196 stop:2506 length:1311 start_codon:yes stop_codon:yes gene_type:complete
MSEEEPVKIKIPTEIVRLAESTKPEGVELEEWILEWAKFGLEVSQKASSRKEALELGSNISEGAIAKFGELVEMVKDDLGTGKGQLLEEVGEQIGNYGERLEELESLTDLNEKEKGFGKLFEDVKAFVDPKNTDSAIYKYQVLLDEVDDENGLVRRALRAELTKDGGLKEQIGKILTEMNIESGKQQIRRKSAIKGGKFEDTLVGVLGELVGSNDIVFQKTSNTIGVLPRGSGNNKKGDIRVNFGKGHTLHGNPIIIEAKAEASFFPFNPGNPEKCAQHYLDKAMENRECSVGIWIQEKKTAGHFDRDFKVSGNTIFVVWDEDDPGTDYLLLAALYIAMGRVKIGSDDVDDEERAAISKLIRNLKDEADRYGRMRKYIDIITTNVKHLDGEITIGTKRISECLDDAKELLNDLDGDSDHSNIEFEDSDSTAASEEE